MWQPAALEKAASLARHANYLGTKLQDFRLALTVAEGLELLEYYAAGHYADSERFLEDLAFAKRTSNPFPMLENFSVHGMQVVALRSLN